MADFAAHVHLPSEKPFDEELQRTRARGPAHFGCRRFEGKQRCGYIATSSRTAGPMGASGTLANRDLQRVSAMMDTRDQRMEAMLAQNMQHVSEGATRPLHGEAGLSPDSDTGFHQLGNDELPALLDVEPGCDQQGDDPAEDVLEAMQRQFDDDQ
ncbi:hypothetical protein AK812_SmicGene19288 [Symbiodinium microadriaticum]|uniref:Uncharacterized protein n=1 Tax=Symbiodinium microadriaticum TaxID=2951 RepID=A0A1Q9DSV3_SYMMI|nr:hypothetical protein AK812_SmicGene19288 [Symbiodinium microadriaticum]